MKLTKSQIFDLTEELAEQALSAKHLFHAQNTVGYLNALRDIVANIDGMESNE